MRILIIGATGQFGSRLARMMAAEGDFAPMLAGRREGPLTALASELGGVETRVLDRAALAPHKLRDIDVVVDAAGPYDPGQYGVAKTAMAAGVHYLDLADNRAFVAGFADLDSSNSVAITGASSTPALSCAAAAAITSGWSRIDTLHTVIAPANRQPRGRSVIESVLGTAGQPFHLWLDGRQSQATGWSDLSRVDLPHVGRRWASRFDAPDHDALMDQFCPTISAEFFASLEHPLMHLGLTLLTSLVRLRLISNLRPLAPPLHWMADRMLDYGNNRGGMTVTATGLDGAGSEVRRRWWLAAEGMSGPHVPVLATLACLRKLKAGSLPMGARTCAGLLALDDFSADFARLGISTGIDDG